MAVHVRDGDGVPRAGPRTLSGCIITECDRGVHNADRSLVGRLLLLRSLVGLGQFLKQLEESGAARRGADMSHRRILGPAEKPRKAASGPL